MASVRVWLRQLKTALGGRGARVALLALALLFIASFAVGFAAIGFGAVGFGSAFAPSPLVSPTPEPIVDAATAEPSETPTIVPTETATPEPSATPSPSPSPTASQTASPTPTPSPTASPRPTVASARSGIGAPILMYHYIRVNPVASDQLGYGLSVTPPDFAAQMGFLAERGYRTVSVPELLAELTKPIREKVVAITFDDGYADAYNAALPVLRARQMRGTFFVISGFVGRGGYLSAEQIREMSAGGMVIGSHTTSHPDLTHLDGLSLRGQLADSRSALEKLIGQPVVDLCYPSGRYSSGVRAEAAATGYRSATTTRYGLVTIGQDPLDLPRVRVSGGMSLGEFAAAIGEQ